MINYIKSELYRISRMKGIYVLTVICFGLLLAMNLVLLFVGLDTPTFPYDTVKFSLGMVEGSVTVVFILTLCIGSIIFADELKNRTIMNSVAFGYSRLQIYFGKIIVALIVSVITLLTVLGIFTGCTFLMLENTGIDALLSMIKCYSVESLILVCGVVAAITIHFLINSGAGAVWTWIGTFLGVPAIASLLAIKFNFFQRLSSWLAYTVSGLEVKDGDKVAMIYHTTEGARRCLLVGGIGTLVVIIAGVILLRKKELH